VLVCLLSPLVDTERIRSDEGIEQQTEAPATSLCSVNYWGNYPVCIIYWSAFSASTLLVGRQEGHPS